MKNNLPFTIFQKKRLAAFLFFILVQTAFAQVPNSYYLPQNISYDPKIPTPQQYLGYQVGDWHIQHEQLLGYMKKVAELSDRVELSEYGRTYENRQLLLLTISSPKNLANIEKIKADHHKLVEPEKSSSLDTKNMPIVVWMGYSVHGNEASGTNASVLALYYLAAAQGAEIDSLLNESVILLDPRINPDGGERFSSWVNANKSNNLVSDPNSRELNEMWPGGRYNHYWFDLNRDWLYTQHPESKGRIQKFHEWKPNILTDHHEMGPNSSFFFQPGIPARTHPLTPKKNIDLTELIGKFHATALDKIGSLYFTKEGYDDFYYGKGSTFPDVQGSIGILFEQASSRGHLQETQNGNMSFAFTVRNQFVTTLSTLRAAKALRQDLLDYQRSFYQEKSTSATKAFVFGGGNDKVKVSEMIRILRQHEIDVFNMAKDEVFEGKTFKKGEAYVVPLSQPQYRLVQGIFEKRTTFEDSLFYDISAWSMPHCFNVPYSEVKVPITLGDKLTDNPFPKGKIIGNTTYGYVFEWDGYFAPRTAYELQKKGYKLKVATEPFTGIFEGGTKNFSYGTVEVTFGSNQQADFAALKTLLQSLAERDGIDFYALQTGLTPSGIDLGSSYFAPMRQPKILMLTGAGVNPNDAGEIWHLLDTRVNIPLTMSDITQVNRMNLEKYNTLILSSGEYATLNEDKIKTWVRNGGTLIALTDAVEWASAKGLSPVKIKNIPNDTASFKPYALAERYKGAQQTSGAIFQVKLDPTHPIGYGYKDQTLSVFRDNNIYLEKVKDPYIAPLIYTNEPLVSGYITERNKKLMKNTPSVVATAFGGGKVIVMTDNPNFRAFWYGTNKLFLNAIFFGSTILSGVRGGEED
ncbi:M14 family metallopeptidase [Arcicella rigui]|uniref:M14 family metallopeptidase n=1 Tax=Arcicella rigui TaxID=797020 RepID=A0ABU5QC07_9BACT|nr:M14 family metallopeptidase [Arcicella rigui]MEA5140389.1 M14 family metallopeptidase [Arcicella rigui]